jgi:hypothetical protein
VNRQRITDVVRWFIEDCIERDESGRESATVYEICLGVDAHAVWMAYERPERMDRFDYERDRWQPKDTLGMLRNVIEQEMVAAGFRFEWRRRAWAGAKIVRVRNERLWSLGRKGTE